MWDFAEKKSHQILNLDEANNKCSCVTHFSCANSCVCNNNGDKQFINILDRNYVMEDDDIPADGLKF